MALKFLTHENISSSLVKVIRAKGYSVVDIKEEGRFGISDEDVLGIAYKENRVVITHDKDFANILTYTKRKHKGVILLRFSNQSPSNVIKRFLVILDSDVKHKFSNSLTIITDKSIKIIEKLD